MTNLSLEQFENGIQLYQDDSLYKFTSDAIKLAKFCKTKRTDTVLDMCAGCGVVGFYAYSIKPFAKLYFNEIQHNMCNLIKKNIELNQLEDKCKVLEKDLNDLKINDFDDVIDIIVCNPPYFKLNGKIKENSNIAMCRHEITTNLSQIIHKASKLIKTAGKFYLIIPVDRMCECIVYLGNNGFAVKNMEIYHSYNTATVCILESVKNGKSGVKVCLKNE